MGAIHIQLEFRIADSGNLILRPENGDNFSPNFILSPQEVKELYNLMQENKRAFKPLSSILNRINPEVEE